MFYLMMTTRFQDIVEAYEIALYIGIRVRDGITDTGLCGKVYNDRNLVLIEDLLHCVLVRNRRVDECPVAAEGLDFAQALVLYIDIIIISYAVYPYDADISDILEKSFNQIATYKAGSSCYQDSFVV